MKSKIFSFIDYSGRRIKLLQKDSLRNSSSNASKVNYEYYIHPALEFPDEVYFFKEDYCNKYIKYYHDFYIVVVVNLNEYSRLTGVRNRIPEWFIINETINYPYYYKSTELNGLTKSGELIYKYMPPASYNSDQHF